MTELKLSCPFVSGILYIRPNTGAMFHVKLDPAIKLLRTTGL